MLIRHTLANVIRYLGYGGNSAMPRAEARLERTKDIVGVHECRDLGMDKNFGKEGENRNRQFNLIKIILRK